MKNTPETLTSAALEERPGMAPSQAQTSNRPLSAVQKPLCTAHADRSGIKEDPMNFRDTQ